MNSKLTKLFKYLIIIFTIVLFFNAYSLFYELKRDVNYYNRAFGLATLDDDFDNGQYYKVYINGLKNSIVDEKLSVDTSQHEAFGRLFEAYINARTHQDKQEYLDIIEKEKKNITWDKILTVVEILENEIMNNK